MNKNYMKTKSLSLTQGDAFNIWSALGKAAYETKDEGIKKTFLDLEEMLSWHLKTYPMLAKADKVESEEEK